jgi:hypothetical protein
MVKVVYEPTESGEDEYTRAHGKLWKRGEAVTLNDKDDEALIKKLRGNPQFSVGNDRKEASEEAKERALLHGARKKPVRQRQGSLRPPPTPRPRSGRCGRSKKSTPPKPAPTDKHHDVERVHGQHIFQQR